MLLRGPNPTGTRPALEFAGNEIAFVVPDDWTTLPDLDAALGGRPQANHCRACGGLPFLARHPRAHRY